MATTFVEYTGDGNATKQFTFPSYQQADIKVTVDGVAKTAGSHFNITSYTTTGGGNVVFTSGNIPSSPALIRIFRDTDVDSAKATFTAGSSVKAADLNANHQQLLYAAQEEQNQLVQTSNIRDNAITTDKIKDLNVTRAKLEADIIDGTKIADDAINSEHYADGSIDTAHIADLQVTTGKIAADAVTGAKIADDAIDSEHYAATSIDTEHIANENITTAKLANVAVTSAKLATDAVTTAKIVDSNVTTAKIADDAVTSAKLENSINSAIAANTAKTTNQTHTGDVTGATSLTIASSAVTTGKIAADAVTGAKIADDAIDSEHITDGSIDTAHIGDSQITTDKIADNAITDAKLAGGALDARYYTETELDAGQLDNRYYTETELNAGQLDNRYFTETELTNGALDGRYFTETEADARYFNISTGDTIKDGDVFPDNDTTIATTAAINDRIIDLVDDVGGFVPIASETAFPSTNPDVNDGAGTLVSIKAIGSTRTPSGGTVTISNGAGSSTVTITGCGSTVLTAGFGVIVETTSTLHTYAFHRLVPKATEVTTVAGISSNVTTVANNSSNITAVANDATDIGTVAGAITNVNNVGGSISNVNTVASNISNVNAVANDATDIGVVAGKATEIGRLGTADAVADMNTLGTTAIVSDMDTLADISSNISTVAGISSNVTTVAGVSGNVTTVAGISSNVTAVANDATDIGTVAGSISNVNTVASANSNITTVANANSNISTVAGANSNISSVAGSISNVNTVANNISSVNNFASQYRVGANNPTTSLDVGDLFFNTTSDSLKVYTGSAWVDGVTAAGDFATVTGNTFTGSNRYNDNAKAEFGTSADLEIFHNGSDSIINDTGTGDLKIQNSGNTKLQITSSGAQVNGNIVVSGNVDGRDVAADGTKLDGIDTNASSFANLVEDTSPQLGGDLDMNSRSISSGTLNIKNTGSQSEVRLFCEVSNAHYVSIKAPAHSTYSGNVTYTLPPTITNGQYIKTDSNGNLSFAAPTENDFTTTLKNKLDGIEAGATADQSNSEIKTAYEANSNTNAFTDALLSKLNGIEAGATADQTSEEIQDIVGAMLSGNTESGITVTYQDADGTIDFAVASQTDQNFTNADHSKLDGIEAGATADQTAAEIRTLVESASDSNVFTDADHTKLNGIEASATADQTASEIKTLLQSDKLTVNEIADSAVTNAKIDSVAASKLTGSLPAIDGSALTGIASAEVYGFEGISGGKLQLTTTGGGSDNISGTAYAAFEDVFFAASGFSFSVNSDGKLIATI